MRKEKEIDEDMKFLAKSEIRLTILDELLKTPKTIRELSKKTDIPYSSISNNIAKLEESDHIFKIKSKYNINTITEMKYKNILDFKKSVDLINNYKKLWNKHNIDQLSPESIKNISDLNDICLIETTPVDIYKTHNTIKEQMTQTNTLYAIFPYLHPEYPKLIENILREDGFVEIIIPQNIFNEIVFEIDEKIRRQSMKNGNLKIYATNQELHLYLTICDNSMSLGLFKNDGSFDQNRILTSKNKSSQNWASNLFDDIKNSVIL